MLLLKMSTGLGHLAPKQAVTFMLAAVVLACASAPPRVLEVGVPSIVRGDSAAAGALLEEDQLAIYREVVRSFFRPTRGQARWIDAVPLAHRRDADNSSVAAPVRAAEIVDAVGLDRVCSAEGPDDDCAGRPGGRIRLSVPYRQADGSAVIFAKYTPGAPRAVNHDSSPFELEFLLVPRERGWRIVSHRSLPVRTP